MVSALVPLPLLAGRFCCVAAVKAAQNSRYNMIPRRLRLSRRDFENAVRGTDLMRATSPHFAISYAPSPTKGGCGVVVAKKVEKSSVKRHLLKRRIREVLRAHCDKDSVLIVYARNGSQTLSFDDLKAELDTLIKRTRA
jgi:ribonuclease P protein component